MMALFGDEGNATPDSETEDAEYKGTENIPFPVPQEKQTGII